MSRTLRRNPHRRAIGRWFITGLLVTLAAHAFADSEYAAAWGPAVGTKAPLLAAQDQHGKQQTLDTLKGEHGLLLVFNRSVDW